MNNETIFALATFALVSSITPGPNNIMLMSSGTNFGFRRTIPHMLGVCLGFVIMLVVVGLGLMQIFTLYPMIQKLLKIICMLYLVYLSYQIAMSSSELKVGNKKERGRPFTFLEAALFQWINPKAITMALAAISIFAPSNSTFEVLLVACVFGLVNLPSVSLWVIIGQQIRKLLNVPKRLRIFNYVMASLLLGTLGFILV